MKQRITIREIAQAAVLAGKYRGEAFAPALLACAENVPALGVLELDFAGIEVLTSSFFKAGIYPIWERSFRRPGFFPMVVGSSPAVADDIELVFQGTGAAAWSSARGDWTDAQLLGTLEPPLANILSSARSGPVSALELYENDRSIGSTAWSNRLAALSSQRLLRPEKAGRQIFYVLPWRDHG